MCDYSLMGVPNRLAKNGEALVLYRFATGTRGFTAPESIPCPTASAQSPGWLEVLKSLFQPPELNAVLAVCIPPGSRLMLQEIPSDLQRSLHVGATEPVTFAHLSADSNTHRDGLRFANGTEISLQNLPEGLRIKILGLDLESEPLPVPAEGVGVRLG